LPDSRLVVQCGVALLDALGCLLLLGLARELRLPALAGLLAMALYLALPINTTMLWWGFATNALAQSLWLLLLWALLRLIRRPTPNIPTLGAALCSGSADWATRLNLVGRGLQLGFLPLTLALAPLGIERLLSARARHPLQRVLVVAWLAVCLIFLAAYLGLGL